MCLPLTDTIVFYSVYVVGQVLNDIIGLLCVRLKFSVDGRMGDSFLKNRPRGVTH